MDNVDDILEHFGTKGMHWGVRRARAADGRVRGPSRSTRGGISADAAKAKESHSTIKTHGVAALSNQDLQHLVSRMNLEQQYTRLTTSNTNQNKVKKGYSAIKAVLGVAKTVQEVHSVANSPMMKDLKKQLDKKK